jgi:hypothetical protein
MTKMLWAVLVLVLISGGLYVLYVRWVDRHAPPVSSEAVVNQICAGNPNRPTEVLIYRNDAGEVGGYLEVDGFAPGYTSHGRPAILYDTRGRELARSYGGFMSDENAVGSAKYKRVLARIKSAFPHEYRVNCPSSM